MSEVATPLFVVPTGGPISSSPLLVDANDDGWPEVFVGGSRFHGLTWKGGRMPRWPKKAKRPFASSAAFGDINGDGRGELVIGCDDGKVYAYHVDGDPVVGWPFATGGDVFSTPALADINSDGALEVIVASDDGSIYVLDGSGEVAWRNALAGSPFVSASPTVVDLDGDGNEEIIVGAWDGMMHAWTSEGRPFPISWPEAGGHIWSSGTAFQADDGDVRLAWASDQVNIVSGSGGLIGGWPQSSQSWMVSSPSIVKFGTDQVGIVVGADRLYGWDVRGRPLPGWPIDLGEYIWSSPLAFDLDGDGAREVVVGGWDGAIHAFRVDGTHVPGFPLQTGGPIFSTPAAAPLPDGGGLLVAASWDGTIRGWRLPHARFENADWPQFRGSPIRTGAANVTVENGSETPPPASHEVGRPTVHGARPEQWYRGVKRVLIHGTDLGRARRLVVRYKIPGEEAVHLSPAMKSGDKFFALIQPLRVPRRLQYWVELERRDHTKQRWPTNGVASTVQFPSPIGRLSQRLRMRMLQE
jgi:WD40 repeat protein